jgi:DNA modification methylase
MNYKKDLAHRLQELKSIEGFPIGKDEDILALSEPPYYTVCPNPYIKEFFDKHGKYYDEKNDAYHKEPFVGDISEGKSHPIYTAHSYHTKVPHKAIEKYIEHYTDEGDIVLDGFCGTGMTGIAAKILNRNCILSDLSPIATFIAHNYNHAGDTIDFKKEATEVLNDLEKECLWMYETNIELKHQQTLDSSQINIFNNVEEVSPKGIINYVVWSDVFLCPFCHTEYVFWEEAIDRKQAKVMDEYGCPNCQAMINKKDSLKVIVETYDSSIDKQIQLTKQIPVLISYTAKVKKNGKWKDLRLQKNPDKNDLELLDKINGLDIPYWFPTDELPNGYNTDQPKRSHGYTNVHHFYTKRNLWCLAAFFNKIKMKSNKQLLFLLTSMINRSTQMNRIHLKNFFFGGGGWNAGYLKGTLYVSSLPVETSIFEQIESRISSISSALATLTYSNSECIIENISSTNLSTPDNSIDYIFTDPPFGSNIMYSELNFIWESWLRVQTCNTNEAIINNVQGKSIAFYRELMLKSFKEFYRVIKPNRWITIEFNNSSSAIWNLIQESIMKSGFIIGQVSVLDKKQGSFKQVTSPNSVKSDLVISAFKPSIKFEKKFLLQSGENLEFEFIYELLSNVLNKPIIERTEQMLYSKMIAYYIQRGYEIRYDSKSFYSMLSRNFINEDGFWFTSNQINSYLEYKKKMKLSGIQEFKSGSAFLFVTDEKSSLVWLFNFLSEPRSYSDISIAFNPIATIQGDNIPELREMLNQNFIYENDYYRRPKSEPEHNQITEKREKVLLKEFESLLLKSQTEKGKIKIVRKEALTYGFEMCYKAKRFNDILALAIKLDKTILENSSELNDFVEAAEIMVEGLS